VFYVYYQDRAGMPVSTILFVQSYFLAVRSLLELPLGALADRYSRRACLVLYAAGHVSGSVLLIAVPTFAGVVVAETLFAVGSASKSGADSAFLFDALKAAGRLDLYALAESRSQAVVSLASGVVAIAGGLLAAIDLRLPYAATALAAAISGVFAWSVTERGAARLRHRTSARGLMHEAVRCTFRTPAVRWVIALAACTVVGSHAYYYLQQPFLRAIGVPLALFGVVFAAVKAVTALVAGAAYRVDAAFGVRGATIVMAATPVVGLSAMSLATGPAAAALLLTRGVLDGLWQPLTNVYLNRLVDSHLRATMLSLQSLVSRLALSAALALLGAGTARFGLAPTLALTALAAALAGVVLVATGPAALVAADGGARACRAESV
jgi:MFS family permease